MGRGQSQDRVSAQVQPQPDPTGALQHELYQRAGLTLRREGWLFLLLRHSGIDSRGGSREWMSCGPIWPRTRPWGKWAALSL